MRPARLSSISALSCAVCGCTLALTLAGGHLACDSFGDTDGCSSDAACGGGSSCEGGACVVGERCGEAICGASEVCSDGACAATPYDQDYVLVVFSAHSSAARPMKASLTLGDTKIINTEASESGTDVVWNASASARVGDWQPLEVLLYEPGSRSLLREALPRVPVDLMSGGEMVFGDEDLNVVIRVWPADAVPDCLVDVECAGGEHCDERSCEPGDRCGSVVCGDGQLCGDDACVDDTFGTPYTLTLVSATLSDGQWDTGFDGTPDPKAEVRVGDELILEGPEQVDTYTATWNLAVTRILDPYARFRVKVTDVDIQGGDLAIEADYPRLPYALVRDGTLTITHGNSSVTLELSR